MGMRVDRGNVSLRKLCVFQNFIREIFQKIERALSRHPKKVLIVEENNKHAKALALFLESFNVNSEIKNSVMHHSVIGSDASLRGLNQSLNLGDSTEIDFG